ncbi:metallophosphoesterase [Thermoproteota archaeon]
MTSLSVLVEAKSIVLNSEENFTIVVLPDTQFYSNNYPRIFENQTQWIIEKKESMNIVFVTHLGDLVDHPLSIKEWNNANTSMSKLDGNVPYGVLPGNHDGAGSGGDLANYNNYFGFNRFNNESWYGGAYQNINTNNYQLFSAGGDNYLIFHIQFNPTDDILSWASNVIDQYPHRKIIVSTHDYVDGWNFFADSRSTIGDIMWKKLVEPHADQIFLVLSGHYENEARLTSSVDGNFVHQLLSDYQARLKGGNGWLRIIEFSPKKDEISIKTYSPYLNKYETDSNSQFILDEIITENNFMFPVYMFLPMIILSVVIMFIVSYFLFRRSHKIKQSGSI